MADNLNPFEEFSTKTIDENITADVPENDSLSAVAKILKTESTEISWDSIAAKLLKDNFTLTALELYTEFIESGKELPRLRDYFSNPGNFERIKEDVPSPSLPRTSSVQTFDSLDFARYSDDGERQVDERVAVLEFELRKAQETIRSLRASLTKQAENDLSTPESQQADGLNGNEGDTISPVEKKALNFLVNEYLLQADYKVTSVTFAEENEEQDFEDWDDVGLNIAKPPGLVHLFKDYRTHVMPNTDTREVAAGTDDLDLDQDGCQQLEAEWTAKCQDVESRLASTEEKLRIALQENEILAQQVDILKIGSPRGSVLRSSSPSNNVEISESTPQKNNSLTINSSSNEDLQNTNLDSANPGAKKQRVDDSVMGMDRKTTRPDARINLDSTDGILIGERGEGEGQESERTGVSTPVVAANLMDKRDRLGSSKTLVNEDLTVSDKRKMTESFKKALLSIAFHVSRDNRIVSEMSKISDSESNQVVKMLARCLPHIVPNVLLAKREELIPVILCTAMLHPELKQRDELLNILFNLIKKPDDDQRQMILSGCVVYAERVGADRLVEELLPQCWEQIGHKYVERRLLVAEACGALASYLPVEIRSSLVLSMLQQMLSDEKDEDVREAVVKSLGLLMGFMNDEDKYNQGYDLLMMSLKDPKEKVQRAMLRVYLPALGAWAKELGRLEYHLLHNILKQLEDTVKGAAAAQRANNTTFLPLNENRFLLLLSALEELIPLLFLTVIETCPSSKSFKEDEVHVEVSRIPAPSSALSDLVVMAGGDQPLLQLLTQFEGHLDQEWFEPWDNLNWVVKNLLPRLLELTMSIGLSMQKIVHSLCQYVFRLCRTFGRTFTEKKVKTKFEELIQIPEESFEIQVNKGHLAINTCIVPVYASGVLMSFVTDEDKSRLSQFLKRVLCTLAFCQTSLDSLRATIIELRENQSDHELILSVLWDGVVHSSAHVRAASASLFELMIKGVSDVLVSSKVVPALVTLANDQELSVKVATIPSLGAVIENITIREVGAVIENITIREVLDRVHMQLQMFFDDPSYRDEHIVHVELIRTLTRCGPSAEPKFRDEFILPRLAAMATANNHVTNETKRRDIAMQLFEAYSALSCCFLSEQVIAEAMLPGLRCVKVDMEVIEADHLEVVNAMIRDLQGKLEVRSATSGTTDDLKATVMSKIKDTTAKTNLSNIFNRKK